MNSDMEKSPNTPSEMFFRSPGMRFDSIIGEDQALRLGLAIFAIEEETLIEPDYLQEVE